MLQDALRITSYKKTNENEKTKKGREKKDTPKNEFIIEENHQQFSRIFTNIAKKMKVKKKNFEKKILNKKKKNLVTLKNKKEMFFLDQI